MLRLEARERKLVQDHPACLESMHELAVVYNVQGSNDDAELLLIQALEDRRLKLSDEHPHTQESWHSLAKPPKSREISGLNLAHD